jgi:hypothetical protein
VDDCNWPLASRPRANERLQERSRGVELLDAILADEDAGYDPAGYPDEELAVLGRLDDAFQLWLMGATTSTAPPGGR